MGTTLIDNFSYGGRKFLDSRQAFATLAEMRGVRADTIPSGFQAYCTETGKWYQYNPDNKEDTATGRWRPASAECMQTTGDSTEFPMSQKAVTKLSIVQIISDTSCNKINPLTAIVGKSLNDSGAEIPVEATSVTPFLGVDGLSEIYSNAYANGVMYAYDQDFKFISGVPREGYRYSLPSGTAYIRTHAPTAKFATIWLYTGSDFSAVFYPYGVTLAEVLDERSRSEVLASVAVAIEQCGAVSISNAYINKIDSSTIFTDGFYIDSTGALSVQGSSCVSRHIDMKGHDTFYTNAYMFGGVMAYDENLAFTRRLAPESDGSFLLSEGERYIRMSVSAKVNAKGIWLYMSREDIAYPGNLGHTGNLIPFGKTYTDRDNERALAEIPNKVEVFDPRYVNGINIFTLEMVAEEGKFIKDDGVSVAVSSAWCYSRWIPLRGGSTIYSNIKAYGNLFFYDADRSFIMRIPAKEWVSDARWRDSMGKATVPESAAYMRFSAQKKYYDLYHISFSPNEALMRYPQGEAFDIRFKRRGKKLVTIGDSITYQRSWQNRLCELTGMWYNPKEIRGDDESVRTEGHGFIQLDSSNADTDTYYEEIEGARKTSDTVTDGFGCSHPVWVDSAGNRFRKPCRTAEGGETVMPVGATSIYSRASDSKYYKGDVIIVFGGANDKATYIAKFPTPGGISNAMGMTNLKSDTEEAGDASYEIFTENRRLTSVGDYTEEGDTQKIKKYDYNFRACFRGLLKRVIDANPDAEVIVIGPFSTMLKGSTHTNLVYDYYTRVQNEVIEECAHEFGCQYIDLYPIFGRYPAASYFSGTDGTVYIHPNSRGGIRIAEYIASRL